MRIMRKMRLFILAAAMLLGLGANAQILKPGEVAPAGTIIYSLPVTTIGLEVTAEHESFVAGPYAKYAQKYLGIEARTESADTYTISSIQMHPYIEADPDVRVAVNMGTAKNPSANFLNFCSQGLIITSDS